MHQPSKHRKEAQETTAPCPAMQKAKSLAISGTLLTSTKLFASHPV
jgi:hypothetical protein